eukprot:202859_1
MVLCKQSFFTKVTHSKQAMATQQEYSHTRMEGALEKHKADDLQELLFYLQDNNNIDRVPTIKQYFIAYESEFQSQVEHYITSKLQLIDSTTEEINRLRYLIHELSKSLWNADDDDDDHYSEVEESAPSLSFSPIVLASPDIDMQPIDLLDIPQTFRPRRFSQIPSSYIGKYKIETMKEGNRVDFPYPNDKVTVQYTMFAIDAILRLMESYVHQVIDLTSSHCMIGLKTAILSMSIGQKCKLFIPRKSTAHHSKDGVIRKHKSDVLVEVILINIIRSDVYKEAVYTNDIIANASKSKRKRANTVSLTPPPLLPPLSKYTEDTHDHEAKRETSTERSHSDDFSIPDLICFGGHIDKQNTDIALEEHKNDMKLLINEIRRNQSQSVTLNLQTPVVEEDEPSLHTDLSSDTNLLEIDGTKSVWFNRYESLSPNPNNQMVEQCMTLCPNIESCECTKRLLMCLKIYQSIMYNRKQKKWSKHYLHHELMSMYYAVHTALRHSNECIVNDFYHCRFYHGHFNRWYEFCRTHYEENYCVYEFIKYEDNEGDMVYKRHCTIYQRYHRNKLESKPLRKRREWFRIQEHDDNGLSDDEMNEIVTLEICDMIHCFTFHSSHEPHLMYAHQHRLSSISSGNGKDTKLKTKERNIVHTDKFTLHLSLHEHLDVFDYDGESFGVLISYKDNTYKPRYSSMKDELTKHPHGLSIHQYADATIRAAIFKQTFIGRQMLNFFGKHINLQQVLAVMCYTNYMDLQKAFGATLHCHNLEYDAMESLRKSHCELFWHWSKMLFSVVDQFGDPIEKDCEFLCKLSNISQLRMRDLSLYTECIYSVSSSLDKLPFGDCDPLLVSIGAKRLGSLYFDASLLSDYPHENEVLLGPSQHLEIRNVIMNHYDNEIYFGAMYLMDALIGHKLSFDYDANEQYQTYLTQIIRTTMSYLDGVISELQSGTKICYEYWQNKRILRLNMKRFMQHISMEQLLQYVWIKDDASQQISFHWINIVMLFPNVERIEVSDIDLNAWLCDRLLQLIQTLNGTADHPIYCGQKLIAIQLFGNRNDFIQPSFNEYAAKFDQLNWLFQLQTEGNWLITKH